MKRNKRILIVVMVLVLLLGTNSFAACLPKNSDKAKVQYPTVSISNGVATCKSRLVFAGKTIAATLTLTQGSTVIDSWSGTGTGYLILSGNANVSSGVTYTLTVSGTIDGVAFTPASINFTP